MDTLTAARVHFNSLSLDSSRSVERSPSQLNPDEPSSHTPPDRDENPSSSKPSLDFVISWELSFVIETCDVRYRITLAILGKQ